MVSKEDAKKEVIRLIDKYNKVTQSGKKYNEEMTKKDFILPLFRALGWDIEDSDEVSAEESLLKGAVDYVFLLNKNYKFFVEAKPLGSDLRKYAQQAIAYGVNSSSTWVVLTNFESIIIFNCEWREKDWWKNALFGQLDFKDYISNFDKLWLLSKEGVMSDALDKYASSTGKRVPRTPIDKELLSKLLQYRMKLSKEISKIGKYNEIEIDEIVQRMLIRLLFIRNCEDRGFETRYKLLSIVEGFKTHKRGLSKFLRTVFDYYNDRYNGSIFKEAEIDKIKFDEKLLADIIEGLYYTVDNLRYNFNIIPADVMGNLYEQYLGHILKKTPQSAKLKEGKVHRKEQGIYYTPTYIVDYIVRNTLGEILKSKKVDASKIRVLDPACGSGSFLVKAFDVLNEHYAKDKKSYGQKTLAGKDITYSAKERILKNNIFGVDLDKQAAEIARLNLLLRIAAQEQKLPLLEQNIKVGNSLTDDPAVAGEKAFKWEEQFKEIMSEGGFDIVVGNPPYVRIHEFDEEIKKCFSKYNSATGQYDIYVLFIEKALNLLRDGGLLGFIVSNKFLVSDYGIGLRKVILSSAKIKKVIDISNMKVFKDASVYPIIIILEKTSNKKQLEKHKVTVIQNVLTENELLENKPINYNQADFSKNKDFIIDITSLNKNIKKKIESRSVRLGDITRITRGFRPPPKNLTSSVPSKNLNRYLIGKDLRDAYNIDWSGHFVKYDENKIKEAKPIKIFLQPKIMIRDIGKEFKAVYDYGKYLCLKTIYFAYNPKNCDLKYIIGILNSKLMLFYFKSKFSVMHIQGGYLRFRKQFLEQLPIKISNNPQELIRLVDKMLSLNKRLNELGDKKTDERARIEEEIKKTDAEIDEIVYKIYGITEKEKKIIEDSLKQFSLEPYT